MKARQMTQSDLAREAGVANSTVIRLLRSADSKPDLDTLRRVADALDANPRELLEAAYGRELVEAFGAASAASGWVPRPLRDVEILLAPDSPVSDRRRQRIWHALTSVVEACLPDEALDNETAPPR